MSVRIEEVEMGVLTKSIGWREVRSMQDLFAEADSQRADYLVIERGSPSVIEGASIATASTADLIVFRDEADTKRWSSLSNCLPAQIYFLAALPSDHTAVAISVPFVTKNLPSITELPSFKPVKCPDCRSELVQELSSFAKTAFVDNIKPHPRSAFQYPALIQANGRGREPWVKTIIDQIPRGNDQATSTAITGLKAGLFLFNDCFDESHSCSQSIEGLGPQHTGDYWHAILHRREPDYGNAKYWFRHVGRHPAYAKLFQVVEQRLHEAKGTLAETLQPWKSKLLPRGSWDAFAFVDLCEAAENGDGELRSWCEQVQYDEMSLLLESTAREANQTIDSFIATKKG